MNVVGIIAEYNPFHNGHRHQIEQIRQHCPGAFCLSVMSGHFTQRGEAAVLDKWQRGAAAVENGLDLVLELPFVFSVRSAQHFASGGVRLLGRLGVVHTLAFGAETTDMSLLNHLAEESLRPETQRQLRRFLGQGFSYAAALEAALPLPSDAPAELLRQPNTILALEYLKAIRRFSSSLTPLALPREGAAYHDTVIGASFPGARAVRTALCQGDSQWQKAVPLSLVPPLKEQQQRGLPKDEALFLPLLTRLLSSSPKDLRQIYGMNEGLENRFLTAARTAVSLSDLRQTIRSKRYPASRIQRMFLSLLLSLTASQMAHFDDAGPLYARVLAFNNRGRQLLHEIRRTSTIPLVTKAKSFLSAKAPQKKSEALLCEMLRLDTLAADLWGLTLSPRRPAGLDFMTSPVYRRPAAPSAEPPTAPLPTRPNLLHSFPK